MVVVAEVVEEVGYATFKAGRKEGREWGGGEAGVSGSCLLYTSPSPRDSGISRMPSSA